MEELETETRHFETEIEQLKTERKERSAALQRKLFEQFRMLNARGEVKDLYTIFEQTVQKVPPAGAGECALPKFCLLYTSIGFVLLPNGHAYSIAVFVKDSAESSLKNSKIIADISRIVYKYVIRTTK